MNDSVRYQQALEGLRELLAFDPGPADGVGTRKDEAWNDRKGSIPLTRYRTNRFGRKESCRGVYESGDTTTSTAELSELAIRQEIESRFLQDKARVEHELAIARRIDSAEEVEIEEYYDNSGPGTLGFSSDEDNFTLGASGRGRRVIKRIYRCKGYRDVTQVNNDE